MKNKIISYIDSITYDNAPIENKIKGLSRIIAMAVFGIIAFFSYKFEDNFKNIDNYYYYVLALVAIIPTITVYLCNHIMVKMYNNKPEVFTNKIRFLYDIFSIIFVSVLFFLLVLFTKEESRNVSSKDLLYTLWGVWIISLIVVIIRIILRRKR